MSRKECFSSSCNQTEISKSIEFETKGVPVQKLEINPENFRINFLKSIKNKDFSRCNITDIRSDLADDFFKIYSTYRDDKSSAIQLFNDFELIKDNFIRLLPENIDDISNPNKQLYKRQPALIETIEGTLIRLDKLETIKNIFENHVKSIIIGGSMSYGQFYNIRENLDSTGSSDIDLIFIVDKNQLSQDWSFIKEIDFLEKEDKDIFLNRKDKFLSFYKHGTADILSKKFNLKDFDFEISIHFFPENVFSNMINENLLRDLSLNEDHVCLLHDYKDNHFPHKQCCQKSFSGKTYEFVVPTEEIVDDGNITTLPGYIISNQEFYPGIYQNLISPMFSVYLDSGDITDKTSLFKQMMLGRLLEERKINKNINFQSSHVRQDYFSISLINSLNKY
ncbi:MAG: hypothetical protein NTY75_04900 [Candidatus Shapirobacteria bacterium]|nr:hypothetical protein [Candidatus Shapirobacteria bacterium]